MCIATTVIQRNALKHKLSAKSLRCPCTAMAGTSQKRCTVAGPTSVPISDAGILIRYLTNGTVKTKARQPCVFQHHGLQIQHPAQIEHTVAHLQTVFSQPMRSRQTAVPQVHSLDDGPTWRLRGRGG
jgi:hypothetical protein